MTTSSPADGLPVVEFFTVPVRVWAAAKEVSRRTMSAKRMIAPRSLLAAVGSSGAVARHVSAFSLEARSLGMTCNRVFSTSAPFKRWGAGDCRGGTSFQAAISACKEDFAMRWHSWIRVLLFRAQLIGRLCRELIHSARCRIGAAIRLL